MNYQPYKNQSDDDKASWLAIALGPKYMSFVDSQHSKPPSLTFS